MKTVVKITALLMALLCVASLFICCTKEGTTDDPASENGSPSAGGSLSGEPSPSAPQLDTEGQGSMPVFEW